VLAHERLGAVQCAGEHVDVLCGADVAEHHGRIALHRRQFGALHRRALERRTMALSVHSKELARCPGAAAGVPEARLITRPRKASGTGAAPRTANASGR
jgi:hypothetical protein